MKHPILLAAAAIALSSNAANPYLPLWEHIPDGEPYVFEDPDRPGEYRVYIYGSHDSYRESYCGPEQVVWSAPVDDLTNWRYDGVIFESIVGADGKHLNENGVADVLFAPDVALVTNADGSKTYYLYPNVQNGGRQGLIAKSNRPDGPFVTCNWSPENPKETYGILRFDPAVFVDDDGRVYGYWGFGESWGAELDPTTMCTVKPGTEAVENMISGYKQDGDFRFFEASSMRKIEDKYVFIYSRWTYPGEFGLSDSNYTLAYAYSDNPLGPFTYGGTIIDGRGREIGPDGSTKYTAYIGGNTHGSICKVKDKWYVFYHRQTGTDEYCRQAMADPINVTVEAGPGGKVSISEAEFTSQGVETEGLPLLGREYPAGIACYFTHPGGMQHPYPIYICSGSYPSATYWEGDPAKAPCDLCQHSAPMVNNTAGSTVGYKYFNFDTANGAESLKLDVQLQPLGIAGRIFVWVGAPNAAEGGNLIGEIALSGESASEPKYLSTKVSGLSSLSGQLPLFFVFESDTPSESLCDFFSFKFVK